MWETWVQSLGWEDSLEKEMAIHSSTLAWKIPWTGDPGNLDSSLWFIQPGISHDVLCILVAQLGKNLPAVRETWVQSLGWEDSLEKGIATHSSILAWRIPRRI